jgi:hypothetical protein
MAKKAHPAPASPKPYEVLAMRLQRVSTHLQRRNPNLLCSSACQVIAKKTGRKSWKRLAKPTT